MFTFYTAEHKFTSVREYRYFDLRDDFSVYLAREGVDTA